MSNRTCDPQFKLRGNRAECEHYLYLPVYIRSISDVSVCVRHTAVDIYIVRANIRLEVKSKHT